MMLQHRAMTSDKAAYSAERKQLSQQVSRVMQRAARKEYVGQKGALDRAIYEALPDEQRYRVTRTRSEAVGTGWEKLAQPKYEIEHRAHWSTPTSPRTAVSPPR